MITRSAVKNFPNECKVAEPLSPAAKKKMKNPVTGKIDTQKPLKAHNNANNSKANLKNVQSPVFNIHVHMPTTMTCNLNKSNQSQPVIHLHFGGLINRLNSDATSENVETISKTLKLELSDEVKCNSEEQNYSQKSLFSKALKKNEVCRKLNFNGSKGSSESLKIDNAETDIKSIAEIKGNEELARNSFCKRQLPLRRSIRLENNRKLLKMLNGINENKCVATKIKRKKSSRNLKIENKSASLAKTLNLKEPVVVLHDIMKAMEKSNIAFHNDNINDKQEDCFSPIDTSADGLETVGNSSCDLLGGSVNEQNLGGNEENEKNLENNSDDQNLIYVSRKFGEVYSLVYSTDNETNSTSGFADKFTFSKDLGINLENEVEHEKSFYETPLNNCVKGTDNNQVNNYISLHSEKYKITAVEENDLPNLLSKSKDLSLNVKHSDINDTRAGLNLKSKDSSCDNECGSNIHTSKLPQTADFEEDNHQTDSPKVSDTETVNLESKNDNLVKNVIEEKKLPSTEANDYKKMNINTIKFQLGLIKKEMKKRDIIKAESSRKKKKIKSQVLKEVPGKSPVAKKVKLPKKSTKDKPASHKVVKTSLAEDYIPLKISGPTKFAVAQLSKVKPFSGHKAKNFRNEMLFGNRVKRYSDPKQREIYCLKKKAAEKRNK